jgi:DNA-binding CsgD family transcriptional regulator
METLQSLFTSYCKAKIGDRATPVSEKHTQELIRNLRDSPFTSVVQAWSVLDLYHYKHLWTEGFDTHFGYRNEDITAETILEMVHPEDRDAFGQLYYLVLEGLMNMPIPVKNIGQFCIAYRLRDAWGNYAKILEINNIIESDPETNIPLICLSQINKIEGLQKSNRVTYYFVIKDENGSVKIMESFLGAYDRQVNIFSKTEIRIANYLKAGRTSKEIADAIFLSKHSIDKYRKNMLEKTGCQNTPQLLAYLTEINIL